ncbi:hypothetical protein PO124_07315 [Bacillus licheniformis]|nr:hypothetical protein [Bacillus licheniformis]
MMPIMAPLADIVGITRQTAILAFQFGDGFQTSSFRHRDIYGDACDQPDCLEQMAAIHPSAVLPLDGSGRAFPDVC